MGGHSLNAPLGSGDDLGWRSGALDEPEQMRGRPPAEQRALPGGQDSGQVGGLRAGRAMPDAVDAAVHAESGRPLLTRVVDLL